MENPIQEQESLSICPIMGSACLKERCPLAIFIGDVENCPILIDPESVEVIKAGMLEAAKYLDTILDLEKGSDENMEMRIRKAFAEKRINWKKLLHDLLSLD